MSRSGRAALQDTWSTALRDTARLNAQEVLATAQEGHENNGRGLILFTYQQVRFVPKQQARGCIEDETGQPMDDDDLESLKVLETYDPATDVVLAMPISEPLYWRSALTLLRDAPKGTDPGRRIAFVTAVMKKSDLEFGRDLQAGL